MTNPHLEKSLEDDPELWIKNMSGKEKITNYKQFKHEWRKSLSSIKNEKTGRYGDYSHVGYIAEKKHVDKLYETWVKKYKPTKKILSGKETREIQRKANASAKKIFKNIFIKVKRKNKTYERKMPKRWDSNTQFVLNVVANKPIKSKEYNDLVSKLVKTTGRTRQAVTKKIQRVRKQQQKNKTNQ